LTTDLQKQSNKNKQTIDEGKGVRVQEEKEEAERNTHLANSTSLEDFGIFQASFFLCRYSSGCLMAEKNTNRKAQRVKRQRAKGKTDREQDTKRD
jgi:hypothetical protein